MLTLYLGTSLDSGEGCVMEHTTDTCTSVLTALWRELGLGYSISMHINMG